MASHAIALKNYALFKDETPQTLERNIRALFEAVGLGAEGQNIAHVKRLSTSLTNSNLVKLQFNDPAAVDVVLMESARFSCEYWASGATADAALVSSFGKLKANILGQLEKEKSNSGISVILPNKGFLCLNRWRRPGVPAADKAKAAKYARGAGGKSAHSWAGD